MFLLALVIATAAMSPSDAANQPAGGMIAKKIATRRYGHHHGGSDDDGRLPLTGVTQCVGTCGTQMTTCLLTCYQPLIKADPVALPYCLLSCSNNATICVGVCAGNIGSSN
ncbi:hypothetical protein QOZ80_1BG0095340 [Eleusine coracana subsp. coracana]|nr:hypothetical protein QOZ80_1BG0095340 [Eleusine coracana subsp. coracana]